MLTDRRTPLHWATAAGQADCVRTLLDLGVQPNPVDSEGGTPLDYARQSGCQGKSMTLDQAEIVKKMVVKLVDFYPYL